MRHWYDSQDAPLGLTVSPMSLNSSVPLECLPTVQVELVCLDQIKGTYTLDFDPFLRKQFLRKSPVCSLASRADVF